MRTTLSSQDHFTCNFIAVEIVVPGRTRREEYLRTVNEDSSTGATGFIGTNTAIELGELKCV